MFLVDTQIALLTNNFFFCFVVQNLCILVFREWPTIFSGSLENSLILHFQWIWQSYCLFTTVKYVKKK